MLELTRQTLPFSVMLFVDSNQYFITESTSQTVSGFNTFLTVGVFSPVRFVIQDIRLLRWFSPVGSAIGVAGFRSFCLSGEFQHA